MYLPKAILPFYQVRPFRIVGYMIKGLLLQCSGCELSFLVISNAIWSHMMLDKAVCNPWMGVWPEALRAGKANP